MSVAAAPSRWHEHASLSSSGPCYSSARSPGSSWHLAWLLCSVRPRTTASFDSACPLQVHAARPLGRSLVAAPSRSGQRQEWHLPIGSREAEQQELSSEKWECFLARRLATARHSRQWPLALGRYRSSAVLASWSALRSPATSEQTLVAVR